MIGSIEVSIDTDEALDQITTQDLIDYYGAQELLEEIFNCISQKDLTKAIFENDHKINIEKLVEDLRKEIN